jgi:hypothetical protein
MPRPAVELADIFRCYGPNYRAQHRLPLDSHKVIDAIVACRTAVLGSHTDVCNQCSHTRISYNSCRNRHCPKCQSLARAKWLDARKAELLPVQYFHVVFTVPEQIAAVAFYNQKLLYDILFQTTAQTLLTIAHDPKHLGAGIGFFAILHTWGQNLLFHPHLHCVIPGGGISPDRQSWIDCPAGFFLPVRVLSRLFRRLFLTALKTAFDEDQLKFFGDLRSLSNRQNFLDYLAPLGKCEWVVYAKAPFGGPQHVLEYLGRYTHRVALSNRRLLNIDNDQVTFRYKNYRLNSTARHKVMSLPADEFMRRFLLHILPARFKKIRFYGFLSNRQRKTELQHCRLLLTAPAAVLLPRPADYREFYQTLTGCSLTRCPVCGRGEMIRISSVLPVRRAKGRPDT